MHKKKLSIFTSLKPYIRQYGGLEDACPLSTISNMHKDEMKFPWSLMFFVTGISLVAFSFAIKLLERHHSKLLLQAGAAAFILGIISWIVKMVYRTLERKKKRESNSS